MTPNFDITIGTRDEPLRVYAKEAAAYYGRAVLHFQGYTAFNDHKQDVEVLADVADLNDLIAGLTALRDGLASS